MATLVSCVIATKKPRLDLAPPLIRVSDSRRRGSFMIALTFFLASRWCRVREQRRADVRAAHLRHPVQPA